MSAELIAHSPNSRAGGVSAMTASPLEDTAACFYAPPRLAGAERGDPGLNGAGRAVTIGAER